MSEQNQSVLLTFSGMCLCFINSDGTPKPFSFQIIFGDNRLCYINNAVVRRSGPVSQVLFFGENVF